MKIVAIIHIPAATRRDPILAWVAQNDPERFRARTVKPSKGHGAKRRPRGSNRAHRAQGDS